MVRVERRLPSEADEASSARRSSRALLSCSCPSSQLLPLRRIRRQGRALHRRDLHPGQRAAGRGGGESPRPRRPADDLLQGRQRRCPAGQIGDRAFPRASHVQGHAQPWRKASSPIASSLMGGEDNAFTTADYTAFHQTVARDHLAEIMRLEADRMTNLVLAEGQVTSERAVIIEERRRDLDNAAGKLDEMMTASLFLNHPYRLPVLGWAHEMAKLSRQDALDFYGRWYAPDNAILVIAGDVDGGGGATAGRVHLWPDPVADRAAPRSPHGAHRFRPPAAGAAGPRPGTRPSGCGVTWRRPIAIRRPKAIPWAREEFALTRGRTRAVRAMAMPWTCWRSSWPAGRPAASIGISSSARASPRASTPITTAAISTTAASP